jgi:hypothetical protein
VQSAGDENVPVAYGSIKTASIVRGSKVVATTVPRGQTALRASALTASPKNPLDFARALEY